MYTCIYMLARCIYTGIEPLVWRVCVHVSHVSHVSRSLARARSLSLSLSQKVLYCGASLCTFKNVHASVGPYLTMLQVFTTIYVYVCSI